MEMDAQRAASFLPPNRRHFPLSSFRISISHFQSDAFPLFVTEVETDGVSGPDCGARGLSSTERERERDGSELNG